MPANYLPSGQYLVSYYGITNTAAANYGKAHTYVLEETFTSNGEWVDFLGKILVEEPGYYNLSACFITTTQKATPKYAPAIDSLRIDAATCYAPYNFKVVDAMITNFHLPESTLIMLVSALAGKENIMNAYEQAVNERYRFFSFGDAMFIKE